MDSIDITDSAFSLEMPDVGKIISTGGGVKDNTMFIYIGVGILVIFIGMFIYKFYMNKKSNDSELDCPGGFCTMDKRPQPPPSHT